MNRLEINPDNEKYYSKEFMQGYKCGTKSQFDEDSKVLEQIRAEIEQLRIYKAQFLTNDNKVCIDSREVLDIIDKYR